MEQSPVKRWPQYSAAIAATIALAAAGAHIGWTSPTLPILKSSDSHIQITSNDASWIASFFLLGTIPGCILAAFIVDWLGRKKSMLIAGGPLLIGFVLVYIAWNAYILYASRFISGIGQGVVYVICPMYIGEIADKEIRGTLGSFIKLMVTFGELYAHLFGPYVTYQALAAICALIPLLFLVTFVWMPESPYYLLIKNQPDSAMANLKKLKRYATKNELDAELEQMQKTVVRDLSNRGNIRDLIGTRGNLRALIISLGLQLVLQFSGIAAIESYTQEILEEGDASISAATAVILLSVFQLIAGIGAAILVDKIGRRPLLLGTTFSSAIALAIIAIFYFLKFQKEWNTTGYGWILYSSVIFYELIIAFGLNPLSYMMLGELFPTNVKGVAVSLINLWASFLAFIVSKLYQIISDDCGVYVNYIWFSATCCLGFVFIVFIVPETRGKSLLDIQEELNCKKKNKTQKANKNAEMNKEQIHISTRL